MSDSIGGEPLHLSVGDFPAFFPSSFHPPGQQLDNLVVPVHFSEVHGSEPRCSASIDIGALLEQYPDNLLVS